MPRHVHGPEDTYIKNKRKNTLKKQQKKKNAFDALLWADLAAKNST